MPPLPIKKRLFPAILTISALASLTSVAVGVTLTWDGQHGSRSDWNQKQNWGDQTAPVAGDTLIFAGIIRPDTNNDTTAGSTYNGISFASGAAAFTLSGNPVTLAGPLANNSTNLQTVNLPLILPATQNFAAASGDLAINGSVSGTAGLTKTGVGTVTLSGQNSFTGVLTISGGTLEVQSTIASSSGVVNDAALRFNSASPQSYGNVIDGTGSLTKSGTGTLTLTGTNTYTGQTTVDAGGTLALTGTGSIANSSNLKINGTLDVTGITSETFTVGALQTLSGSGTIEFAGKDVSILGTHAPGNSPGLQTINGSTTYGATSIFAWDLAANTDTATLGTRGTDYDAVNVNGNVIVVPGAEFRVIQNPGLNFADAFWTSDRSWTDIFVITGNGSTGWADGTPVVVYDTSGVLQNVSNFGSFTISGFTLNWTAIPEPTSALAGGLLLVGLLRRRRG